MKLKAARVREFKSIWDSDELKFDGITCLVGKNEAGKTALLQALYRLNPIIESDGDFDLVQDYPRSEVEDYRQDVDMEHRRPATVVEATFELDADELLALEQQFGTGVLNGSSVKVSKGYAKDSKGACVRSWDIPVNEAAAVNGMLAKFGVPDEEAQPLRGAKTIAGLTSATTEQFKRRTAAQSEATNNANAIADEGAKAAALEAAKLLGESEQHKALRAELAAFAKAGTLEAQIRAKITPKLPAMMYFDEYYQLSGHDNIQALKQRRDNNKPNRSDHPLLGLIELARLDLDDLLTPTRTQELKNKLEGASNFLSRQVLKYWSQNKHLRMTFDVRPGLPGDPAGMQTGTNLWGEVFDTKHSVSTGLGTRSAGFVWFFSFLAWYSSVKKRDKPVVLLLDEPGLTLHGRAQEDLLRYFEEQIGTNDKHQLVYTTHSPFMVDPRHFERVRIVQDRGVEVDELPRDQDGTKVISDILEATQDSLFPLQGALGYGISQTLFVGPYNLVVEGVSDLLYLQTMSAALTASGRAGLDPRWTITPVGGADRVPSFVALLGSQRDITVATLIDIQRKDEQSIKNLYEKKLLKKANVLTFADFAGCVEADIEDMFDAAFYLSLINAEFATELGSPVPASVASGLVPRILRRLEDYFKEHPLRGKAGFSHYRPARRFAETGGAGVDSSALNRFEAAFRALNRLLPT